MESEPEDEDHEQLDRGVVRNDDKILVSDLFLDSRKGESRK